MLAQRIERARKTSGLSLRDLAAKVGVSQTAINKFEKGTLTPDSTMLIKLAKALNVKVGYFLRSTTLELEKPEYRKKSTLSAKKLQMIEGKILDLIERRMELESLFPKPPVQEFVIPSNLPEQVTSMDEIEEVAKSVREQWQLGLNPIPELVDVLESKGVRVFEIGESADSKFDGLAAKVNGQRVIVISSNWSGDRQRFTMAHELGHLILEGRLIDELDEELACHRFAGAFLLPEDAIWSELGEFRTRLELQELLMLKQEFGISMSGILYRAKDLGIIKQSYHKQLMIEFSKRRWRKNEPQPYPAEKPHHFKQLVFHALAEEYIGESKAADLMDMSVHKFYQLRMIEDGHAASDQ
ncbi:XRE family transcriptional regulator [Sulfurimonas sp. HSL1-2]|uniref:helix-turn-helix domain-containing protein n=1 Tax=Thiomicrolovo zhangzhouensis TaxID=3131933 RepID=UPI0031F7F205